MAKVALLIGVSEYDHELTPLPAAVKDVETMQQVLLHPEMGGFAEIDITVLKNPQRLEMEEAIENLFAYRQRDDLLVLFFSGHGIKDDTGKLFLATRTTRKTPKGDLIRASAVAANSIHESMSRSRSKRQVVILDSCFSGAFAEGLAAKDDGTVNIREQLGGEGRAILTSSSSTQYSFEQQGSDLSIYTRYLIEGITTGAADRDDDGFVSIGELHEYASGKVREIQPTMKPEIHPGKEGYTIRLAKVPLGDPKQRYGKEVARYIKRGEISFIGRQTLDVLTNRLGLSQVEATAIEDEILAVARQEFRKKLQQYEQAFTNAVQQEVAPNGEDLNELRQNLQKILDLRNEDIMPIEAKVKTQIESYKQHLQKYEQALAEAMQQEYPLSQITRQRLQQMQQQWQLSNEDLVKIERGIVAEIKAYRQKLQQYEQVFTRATQQEYPLTALQRNKLQQEQQNLGLRDKDVAPIEARIKAEIELYQQKLKQYEQVLAQEVQHEYPFREEIREDLRRYQHALEIKNEDVARIEEKVVQHQSNQKPKDPPIPPISSTEAKVVQQHLLNQQPKDSAIKTIKTSTEISLKVGVGLATAAMATGISIKLFPSKQPTSLSPYKAPINTIDPRTSGDTSSKSFTNELNLGGNVNLTGAGASFPGPLYQTWFAELNKKYPSLRVNYQSVGSGAGVEQFTKGTVDFGASDVAMKDEEIAKVPQDRGVILLPVTAGSIVLAYNLPDVTDLKLPRVVYTDITLGKIKSWDDPAIAKANPEAKLPKQLITVVYRADGSGTTGVFTKHLSAISPEWKIKVGEGKSVKWPVGVGGKGNEGVTAQIQQTQGAIGYVEYGYAKQNNLKTAALENKSGTFITANAESTSKTLEAVTLPENLRAFISDPEGADSYPIVTYTWLLAYKKYPDAAKAKAIEAAIEYALTDGQKLAGELGYVHLPASVVTKVAAAADKISPDYKISVFGQ